MASGWSPPTCRRSPSRPEPRPAPLRPVLHCTRSQGTSTYLRPPDARGRRRPQRLPNSVAWTPSKPLSAPRRRPDCCTRAHCYRRCRSPWNKSSFRRDAFNSPPCDGPPGRPPLGQIIAIVVLIHFYPCLPPAAPPRPLGRAPLPLPAPCNPPQFRKPGAQPAPASPHPVGQGHVTRRGAARGRRAGRACGTPRLSVRLRPGFGPLPRVTWGRYGVTLGVIRGPPAVVAAPLSEVGGGGWRWRPR